MTSREDAARKFAEAMGWGYDQYDKTLWCFGTKPGTDSLDFVIFPAPDAPLHKQLAFVGRVAEAIGEHRILIDTAGGDDLWVRFGRGAANPVGDPSCTCALDLAHAALLAGIAALEAREPRK